MRKHRLVALSCVAAIGLGSVAPTALAADAPKPVKPEKPAKPVQPSTPKLDPTNDLGNCINGDPKQGCMN